MCGYIPISDVDLAYNYLDTLKDVTGSGGWWLTGKMSARQTRKIVRCQRKQDRENVVRAEKNPHTGKGARFREPCYPVCYFWESIREPYLRIHAMLP